MSLCLACAHMPLSSRRVVIALGEVATYKTAIGSVEGLADGVILIRTKGGEHCELSVAEARDLGQAAARAAFAVESWQKYASGYHVLQVRRTAQGEVWVDCRGQHRTMRISTLRGSRYGRGRTCYGCHQKAVVLWVATPDPHRRKGDSRDSFPEVCEPCVERLANVPHPRGRVAP